MNIWQWLFGRSLPTITLGTLLHMPWWWFRSYIKLTSEEFKHIYIIGTQGSGKTSLIKGILLQLIRLGIGFTFIDPHGDAAKEIRDYLIATDWFKDQHNRDRFVYLAHSDAHEKGWFLPWNVLNRLDVPSHLIAADVRDAMHAAWQSLDEGAAPRFDTYLNEAIPILVQCQAPLIALKDFMENEKARDWYLTQAADNHHVPYWRNNFEGLRDTLQIERIESVSNRLSMLTSNPALRNSLGQPENCMTIAEWMDDNKWVIHDLSGIQERDAQRLYGSLLTSSYHRATMARIRQLAKDRKRHYIVIDEFGLFVHSSQKQIGEMLSESRKYNTFLILAHQTLSQINQYGKRLEGALGNANAMICLRVSRADAEILSREIAKIELDMVKSEAKTEYTQPVFATVQDQYEQWIQSLTDQSPREGWIKWLKPKGQTKTVQFKTLDVPTLTVSREQSEAINDYYRRRYMRWVEKITLPHEREQEPIIRHPKQTR